MIGGIYSNSLALLADAGHMLTDVAALGLSLFAIWFASKPATPNKTYGFYRVEILAALLNGVFLVLLALLIAYESYERMLEPQSVRANLMLIVASGGLLANLVSAYILFGKQSESLNVRGAFFHVLSDTIGLAGADSGCGVGSAPGDASPSGCVPRDIQRDHEEIETLTR